MKEFYKNGILYARLIEEGDWADGLTFLSNNEEFIQVGTMVYPEGKIIAAHTHNLVTKTATRTQEVLFIKSGAIKVTLFDVDNLPFQELILNKDDIIVLLNGGHGFLILRDNTQILEIKNGPYSPLVIDKVNY